MRIAICEDEKIYSDHLRRLTEEFFRTQNTGAEIRVFSDGAPLLDFLVRGGGCDLIFLDIQLENSDGVEVARRIRELDGEVAIVFVTGLEGRSLEGYEVSAFDYVVKNSLDERFGQVLNRFLQGRLSRMLTVPLTDGDTAFLAHRDVLWIESEGRGTRIGGREGELHSTLPVGKLAAALPPERFAEVHKSVYVQLREIRRIGADTVEVNGGTVLPLSRRKRKAVLSAVMAAVKGKSG